MCGIYGIINSKEKLDADKFKAQLKLLSHRGPDGSDCWVSDDRTTALGHTRLSIIDISNCSKQPMVSP